MKLVFRGNILSSNKRNKKSYNQFGIVLHLINDLLQSQNFLERCTYLLHEGHYVVAQHPDDSVSIPLFSINRGFLNPNCASRHFLVMSTDIKTRVCYWFAIADLTTILWYLQNCRILIGTRCSRAARPPAARTSPVASVITCLQSDMSDPGVLSRDPENEVSMYLMRLRVSQQKRESIIYNVHFTCDLYVIWLYALNEFDKWWTRSTFVLNYEAWLW